MDNKTRKLLAGGLTIFALVLIWLDSFKDMKGLIFIAIVVGAAIGRILAPTKTSITKEKK